MNTDTIQEQAGSAVDTLTQSYSGQWEASAGFEESSAFVQLLASNDLIFVVLSVSLVIWFVLLFFMVRTDRKVTQLEKAMNSEEKNR